MRRWDIYWIASLVWLAIILTGIGIFVATQAASPQNGGAVVAAGFGPPSLGASAA